MPDGAELTGLYAIAAVATVGSINHPCMLKVAFGFAAITRVLQQLYSAFECSIVRRQQKFCHPVLLF
ncbi:MAG: hypothetical protein EA367_18420 [Leptolyngbya sp. DLM2.Bin15]|nr:MAG: hypothetical protein EA367_18420 [Leptolyngbya sp. DLM2.Bin15]